MSMGPPRQVDTVVVGAGHAGLTMSRILSEAGRDHVVLEKRSRIGGGWQDRWDNFRLVSPNWTASFPGYAYDGPDPDAFMPRDEIVERVARYAEVSHAPVITECGVYRVAPRDDGFLVETAQGPVACRRVVVAIGGYQQPRIPAAGANLSLRVHQLHSHAYRNEAALPPGAVLVVGSGQTGVQIAEELHDAGRRIYLSVGSAGRAPRRYRGRDIFFYLHGLAVNGPSYGVGLPTVDTLPDPRLRFAANPHLSGHKGGHDTNLRQLARDGITLTGHLEQIDGEHITLAPDLAKNLAWADQFFDVRMRPMMDRLIEVMGIDAGPDDRVRVDYEPPSLESVDLGREGIGTVIWTTGYRLDLGWIDPDVRDEMGYPRHTRGVTEVPGLYFLGLPWLHTQGSATLFGVRLDARHIAEHMGVRPREAQPA